MEFSIETDDNHKLLTLTVEGELSVSDTDKLAQVATEYEGKEYRCILDITGMDMIGMDVAGHAVRLATGQLVDGFDGYCLVAVGTIAQLISMFAGGDFVTRHLASSLSEARLKLGL